MREQTEAALRMALTESSGELDEFGQDAELEHWRMQAPRGRKVIAMAAASTPTFPGEVILKKKDKEIYRNGGSIIFPFLFSQ